MKKNILIAISILLLISVIYNIYFIFNFRGEAISLLYKIYSATHSDAQNYPNLSEDGNPTPTPPGGVANMSLDQRPLMKWRGVIKKEAIPKDYELGDFWYQFYFSEPYLNENNAAGIPMYIDNLEITQIKEDVNIRHIKLDDYLDKEVEVAGYFGWGLAESTTIEPIAVVELK